MNKFTLETLRAIIRSCVGVEDGVDLDSPIDDVPFDDLGYDSLALLEIASQLRRQYGVDIPDDGLGELMPTPAAAVEYVNRVLASKVGV